MRANIGDFFSYVDVRDVAEAALPLVARITRSAHAKLHLLLVHQPITVPEGVSPDAYVPPERQLRIVEQKKIDIPADALICSLEHDIKIAEL